VLIEISRLRMPGDDLAPAGTLGDYADVPTNVLVLNGHGSTVLIDAGAGILASWYPGEGVELTAVLNGREPDLVVLTHLDFDHVGGLLDGTWPDDLRPTFPSTPVVVLDAAARAARDADPDRPWNSGTRSVLMLERADLLREVSDGEEIVPGLTLRSAPGHRSGHAVLRVGDGMLHLADTIHHALHVEHPDWDGRHDGDRALALRTRIDLLEEAAEKGTLCVSSHIRGAGRIERASPGLRWAPL
jgi:glyoxylase-like metal-dependent hydrolase (beta-lactamase superfamily II)